ncbi:MAG: glycosyltransferase, partial [Alphaproteobacteria bacterium]|nr:glycosyltransferase [Alphaproteobacteria bacterium]
MTSFVAAAFLPIAIWAYLLLGRGMFWLAAERDEHPLPKPSSWPSVTAIVPARNEADVVARSLGSLLSQDYPGSLGIVFVDDQSEDGTAAKARALDTSGKLSVISGTPRPAGWSGKLWAMSQGVAYARAAGAPDYFWFTDADIAHTPDTLRSLVGRAEAQRLVLVSLMAKLSCVTPAERFFIPAFVYFFQMLYPFAGVNDPNSSMAAAAGGCMLVRHAALESAGGLQAIRNALIDDCALGRIMKAQGPIWLGLTDRAVSIRPYPDMSAVRHMVARSAYAQLSYSPLLLAGTVLGLLVMFVVPVLLAVFDTGMLRLAGIGTWLLMAASFTPMLRFYRRSALWSLALPLIAFVYAAFTLDSAVQHWRGR